MNNFLLVVTRMALALTLIVSTMSFASETTSQGIETIEVTGKQPVSHFEKLMNTAEVNFYEMYNDITTNRKFKVECKRVARHSFSRIKERKCIPAFADIAMFEQMDRMNALRGPKEFIPEKGTIFLSVPHSHLKVATDDYSQQQLNDILDHLSTHPELLEKYNELVTARSLYQQRLALDEK